MSRTDDNGFGSGVPSPRPHPSNRGGERSHDTRDCWRSPDVQFDALADWLERGDLENAIVQGSVNKKMTRDPRGIRYRVEGPSRDGRKIHVICRLDEDDQLRIITVYALTEGD